LLTIWYSDSAFAEFLISHVPSLDASRAAGSLTTAPLLESDARSRAFHRMPTHLKQILYLDCPDIVIEKDNFPVVSIEVSEEAGTGHNVFQRFGRLAAAVERKVPALYLYPEAVWVDRADGGRWDQINPLIFHTLEKVMEIYGIPALFFSYPTQFQARHPEPPIGGGKGHRRDSDPRFVNQPNSADPEMQDLFDTIDLMVHRQLTGGSPGSLVEEKRIQDRRAWMRDEYAKKGGPTKKWSPETAAQTVPSAKVIDYIQKVLNTSYLPTGYFADRAETVVYCVNSKAVRADPYTGAFAALDYLQCRRGETFEEREKNLVFAWGDVDLSGEQIQIYGGAGNSVDAYTAPIRRLYGQPRRVLLGTEYDSLRPEEIPRYFMQVRFGTTFSKEKVIRMLAYFADAILFHDGAIWREG
jgi:hypothetical protein